MSELKIKDLEKALSLKMQEIDSLKAQNGRLIEKLQEEIDRSASATIQKEIIHKEIIRIHMTLREVHQQGQLKKSILGQVSNQINDVIKAQVDTNLEIEEQKQQIRATQLAVNNLVQQLAKNSDSVDRFPTVESFLDSNSRSNITSALLSPSSDDSISDDDLKKISHELKNELSGNKEDLNLILQMLNEKTELTSDGK